MSTTHPERGDGRVPGRPDAAGAGRRDLSVSMHHDSEAVTNKIYAHYAPRDYTNHRAVPQRKLHLALLSVKNDDESRPQIPFDS